MIKQLSIVFIVAGALLGFSNCQPSGVIEDLGTLGGDRSGGLGINEAGNVTGYSYVSRGDPHTAGVHAFRYVDGLGMIDVGALPNGNISEGLDINNNGLIVGLSLVQGQDFVANAFLATSTLALSNLGTVDFYSEAKAINDSGLATGAAQFDNPLRDHAFIWTRATGMQDLGTLGGSRSAGTAINENGQIAGVSSTANDGTDHAFRYTAGIGMQDLGTLGGKRSSAYGINNTGKVVGESDFQLVNTTLFSSRLLQLFGTHAFLWTENVGMIDLGHLGGGHSTGPGDKQSRRRGRAKHSAERHPTRLSLDERGRHR